MINMINHFALPSILHLFDSILTLFWVRKLLLFIVSIFLCSFNAWGLFQKVCLS